MKLLSRNGFEIGNLFIKKPKRKKTNSISIEKTGKTEDYLAFVFSKSTTSSTLP